MRPHWILWSVDDRTPIMRRGKPYRYRRGVLQPCDPTKRTAFSYFRQLWGYPGASSPWTYDRKEAHVFYSKREAFLMRDFIFEAFKGGTKQTTPRACYGVSRVLPLRSTDR